MISFRFKHHYSSLNSRRKKTPFLFLISLINPVQIKPANHRSSQPINQSKPKHFLRDLFIFLPDCSALLCSRSEQQLCAERGGVGGERKLGGRTNTFIAPRLCQTHMGSSVLRSRTRRPSAPAAARRAPSARSGAALSLPGLSRWHIRRNSHYTSVRCPFPLGEARLHTACCSLAPCERQPRRTNCVLARGELGLLWLWGKRTKTQNPREKHSSPVAPPETTTTSSLCYFLSFFSCDLFPAAKPGTRDWARAPRMKEN